MQKIENTFQFVEPFVHKESASSFCSVIETTSPRFPQTIDVVFK